MKEVFLIRRAGIDNVPPNIGDDYYTESLPNSKWYSAKTSAMKFASYGEAVTRLLEIVGADRFYSIEKYFTA